MSGQGSGQPSGQQKQSADVAYHNASHVDSQTGVQNVFGTVNHYHGGQKNSGAFADADDDPLKSYDQEILKKLSFPEMHDRRSGVHAPYKDTCDWIWHQPEFNQWLEMSRGMLWVTGKAGSGKSTLMAYIYLKLKESCITGGGIHLEFFFNARGAELQKTPAGMLRSLLNQVFRYSQNPELRAMIRTAYKDKQDAFGNEISDWQWQLAELERLTREAILIASKDQPVMIFVDALDEAGTAQARHVARYLQSISEGVGSSQMMKMCISCRPYPDVIRPSAPKIQVDRLNKDAISTFVEDCIDHADFTKPDWVALRKEIVDRANGLFQWVCLVTQLVVDYIDDGHSAADVRVRLQHIPPELNAVYEHVFRNVIRSEHYPACCNLFRWLIFAQQPLTLSEIRWAMATAETLYKHGSRFQHERIVTTSSDEQLQKLIKAWSGGLVEISKSGLIQVIHQSVNDFMLDNGFSLLRQLIPEGNNFFNDSRFDWRPSLNENSEIEHHAILFSLCQKYISHECGVHQYWDFEPHSLTSRSPLIRYAVQQVFWHAKRSDGLFLRLQVLGDVVQSLQNSFARWSHLARNLTWHGHISITLPVIFNTGITLLHVACDYDIHQLVFELVKLRIDIDHCDAEGNAAIHAAATKNALVSAKILRDAGVNISSCNVSCQTPLILAAIRRHGDFVQWLLDEKAHYDMDVQTRTLTIEVVAAMGHSQLLEHLVEHCVSVNHFSRSDMLTSNTLRIAAANGHKEVVRFLLDTGAQLDHVSGPLGGVLKNAVSYNGPSDKRNAVVQLLLQAGAPLDMETDEHVSALTVAAGSLEKFSTFKLLLDAGADVHCRYQQYETPLIAACNSGHEKAVKLLLAAGAEIGFEKRGVTALSAALNRQHCRLAQYLLETDSKLLETEIDWIYYCADILACNDTVLTHILVEHRPQSVSTRELLNFRLLAAVRSGKAEEVESLLNLGADVDTVPDDGDDDRTPFLLALLLGEQIVACRLLARDANHNIRLANGSTPLHIAVQPGQKHVVAELCQQGAEIDARNQRGETPLHLYIRDAYRNPSQTSRDILELLICNGADPNARDVHGKSCFDYVTEYGLEELRQALSSRISIEIISERERLQLVRQSLLSLLRKPHNYQTAAAGEMIETLGWILMQLSECNKGLDFLELSWNWPYRRDWLGIRFWSPSRNTQVCRVQGCRNDWSKGVNVCLSCPESFLCDNCRRFLPFAVDDTSKCRDHQFMAFRPPHLSLEERVDKVQSLIRDLVQQYG